MCEREYSVSAINQYINNMFLQDYLCSSVVVRGELSNVKYHSSGHIYFSLKDAGAVLSCIMYAGRRGGLDFRMQDGQEVRVKGSIHVYERDGKYQLYADRIRQCGGMGNFFVQLQELKNELAEMGMFDPVYKQPIPRLVKRLGVVAAATGDAVHDIIQVSKRRNPYVEIILYSSLVQGEGAAADIINGIRALKELGVDVIIVARGGGSREDLWTFNNRELAQAVFDCTVPLISAVGHETHTPIIDEVADRRASTPTEAATIAVCEISSLMAEIDEKKKTLDRIMRASLEKTRLELENRKERISARSPKAQLMEKRMRLSELQAALENKLQARLSDARRRLSSQETVLESGMQTKLVKTRHRFEMYISRLSGLSPLEKMAQGYSYVATKEGRTLTDIQQVQTGDELTVHIRNGELLTKVLEKRPLERF